jgi:hypothetical protein
LKQGKEERGKRKEEKIRPDAAFKCRSRDLI